LSLATLASDKCDEPFGSIATRIVLINSVTVHSVVEIVHHGFGLIVNLLAPEFYF